MARFVLIDDDPAATDLAVALQDRSHQVDQVGSGFAGLRHAIDDSPDALIVGTELPDLDGVEAVKLVRAVSDVPLIALAHQDDEELVVRALDAGADDCIVPPVSVDRLEARLRALFRRVDPPTQDRVTVGDLVVEPGRRTAWLDGHEVGLAPKEFDVLHHLAQHAGEVVPKRDLLAAVWPEGATTKSVDVHVSWLRSKLGETAAAPRHLRTVRGVGIQLCDPDGSQEAPSEVTGSS